MFQFRVTDLSPVDSQDWPRLLEHVLEVLALLRVKAGPPLPVLGTFPGLPKLHVPGGQLEKSVHDLLSLLSFRVVAA